MAETVGALSGIRVLDLGLLVQGPQAAQLLGELGADVIKVELPGLGDQGRWIPISMEDLRAPYFVGCNRGKRSLTLDLRRPEGREVFLQLVASADIVISNFLPGTLEGWGIGYDEVAAIHPRVIYGSGSTFGPKGPDADRKGADIAGQASGGLVLSTGSGEGDAGPVGVTIADHIGSQNLVAGVLAALYARERTGKGQHVQVSLLGGQIYAQASEYAFTFMAGREAGPARGGHPLIPMMYGILPTADGHIVLVGVKGDERQIFYDAVGHPELVDDERFSSLLLSPESRTELFAILAESFRKKTTSQWEEILRAAGQRYAAVRTRAQVGEDPGVFENGYLQKVQHPEWGEITMPGCPIAMSDTPSRAATIAPELGQHTEEILLECGLAWEEISRLRETEII